MRTVVYIHISSRHWDSILSREVYFTLPPKIAFCLTGIRTNEFSEPKT